MTVTAIISKVESGMRAVIHAGAGMVVDSALFSGQALAAMSATENFVSEAHALRIGAFPQHYLWI